VAHPPGGIDTGGLTVTWLTKYECRLKRRRGLASCTLSQPGWLVRLDNVLLYDWRPRVRRAIDHSHRASLSTTF
jgi:hypothetical protein